MLCVASGGRKPPVRFFFARYGGGHGVGNLGGPRRGSPGFPGFCSSLPTGNLGQPWASFQEKWRFPSTLSRSLTFLVERLLPPLAVANLQQHLPALARGRGVLDRLRDLLDGVRRRELRLKHALPHQFAHLA